MSECNLKYTGPVPEGYELTGEVRVPKPGEYVLDDDMLNVIAREARVADHVSVILRKKKWKPITGETYWVLQTSSSSGLPKVVKQAWQDCICESMWSDSGNCFRTYEEAEAVAEKIRTLFKKARQ